MITAQQIQHNNSADLSCPENRTRIGRMGLINAEQNPLNPLYQQDPRSISIEPQHQVGVHHENESSPPQRHTG